MNKNERIQRTENKVKARKNLYKHRWGYNTNKDYWSSWIFRFYLNHYGWAKALAEYEVWQQKDLKQILKREGQFKDKLSYDAKYDKEWWTRGLQIKARDANMKWAEETMNKNLERRRQGNKGYWK